MALKNFEPDVKNSVPGENVPGRKRTHFLGNVFLKETICLIVLNAILMHKKDYIHYLKSKSNKNTNKVQHCLVLFLYLPT